MCGEIHSLSSAGVRRTVNGEVLFESGVQNAETQFSDFRVIPNPNNKDFVIELNSEISEGSIHIFNILGQEAWNNKLKKSRMVEMNENCFRIQGSAVYHLQITHDHQNYLQSMMIAE